MKNVKAQAGFSLIELMVVVAIIGILATVAVPNFQRFQGKAVQTEAKSSLSGFYMAATSFQNEYSTYDADWTMTGFNPAGNLKYRIISSSPGTAPGTYTGNRAAGCVTTAGATMGAYAACNGTNNYTNKFAEVTGLAVAPAALTIATNATAFQARAATQMPNAATHDEWTIDNTNVLTNTILGLP